MRAALRRWLQGRRRAGMVHVLTHTDCYGHARLVAGAYRSRAGAERAALEHLRDTLDEPGLTLRFHWRGDRGQASALEETMTIDARPLED